MKEIRLWGVRQNNLKNIDVKIPLGSFTVVCGPSGSGKSSLAFETLYAEGQRRYIESLSNYTKQFLNKAPKPDLDSVENIPPAISLEQKNSVKSSRSSVGTTTEIIDFLRLLYEKIGRAKCPDHKINLEKESPSRASEKTLEQFTDQRGYILAPIMGGRKKNLTDKKLLALLLQDGILRIYVPKKARTAKATKSKTRKPAPPQPYSTLPLGEISELTAKSKLPKDDFYVVVDRLAFTAEDRGRLTDSFTQAYHLSLKYNSNLTHAQCEVVTTEGQRMLFSEETSCTVCSYRFPEIHSSLFSFNSPVGACPECKGFGNLLVVDEAKVIPNPELSIAEGALKPFAMPSAARDRRQLLNYCKKMSIDIHSPWKSLPAKHRETLWKGNKDFWGIEGLFEYLDTKKYKMHVRVFIARHKSPSVCPKCKGTRLKPEALQVFIQEKSIGMLTALTAEKLLQFFKDLSLTQSEKEVSTEPLRQLISRLEFLCHVGLGYLTLDRPTKTLSGGEFQRVNLSTQLGVGLSQTLYVLDEPTIGLHPRDNDRLIEILHQLNALGNTLVVVEHDQDVISNSSHVLEMGPGSGRYGGEILFAGTQADFLNFEKSNTAPYIKMNHQNFPAREPRRVDISNYKYMLELTGCRGNNLKDVDLRIPLNRIVTVTGVSGSGKSSLISDTLYPSVARELGLEFLPALAFDKLKGTHHLRNVLFIDQTPIGTTTRSNPVTYMKIYDAIRTVMASSNEARALGYDSGTFSLNIDGGRCPVCKGLGVEVIDMMFMDDIAIPCDECDGKKFRKEVLDITYKGKNIHEILNLTVAEAMDFFVSYPNIRRPLSILKEVGLDYISLGQSARSLSGGESQRLKIAREFASSSQEKTLYILDEPTTGLHFKEIQLLIKALNRLVDAGGSVLLIEHNMDVIRASDYIIDLGPDAGAKGGQIVVAGTPEDVKKSKSSLTGKYI